MRENVTQGSDGSCSQLLASHMWWNSLQKTPNNLWSFYWDAIKCMGIHYE